MADSPLPDPQQLAAAPPEVLRTFPALPPPLGVQSNFVNPNDRMPVLRAVGIFLLCFMTLFYVLRVYTNAFIIRRVAWDDLTCAFGFLGSVGTYIACYGGIRSHYGRHMWDVTVADLLTDNNIVASAFVIILCPTTFLFIKLTFFLFYYQVFKPLRWLRISVYIGGTLTSVFYGATTITQLVFTTRRRGETWVEHFVSPEQYKANVLSVPMSAVGLAIDVVLLALPIKAVIGLQLPTKRKIGVLSIFMFGLLACIGSILSIYYRVLDSRSQDRTWTVPPVELVTLVEMNIGIVCLSLPAFSKMVQHHLPTFVLLRSIFQSSFAKIRSSETQTTAVQSESMKSDTSYVPTLEQKRGPYAHLQHQPSQSDSLDPDATYELGQLTSIRTIIQKGVGRQASDDKIHLTHEIMQQQATVPQRDLGRFKKG